MTAYWLAQGVGVIAFLIGITTFINRDERRFRLQLAVYSAIIGVHFFLMGAGPAGMSVMWCSTACWVTHNLWLGSIGGTLIEGSFLIVNGLNIIRFRRMQKRGIDPFKVENAVQEESPSAR